ncbi:hypothetical protein J4421_05770 [Candidatus Woesearchaeota archaeon]|nr:hypothetical protein [Candidatus Woesearchaeota archaeon]
MVNKPRKYCPKCGSFDVELYDDLEFIHCNKCGYEELDSETFPYGVRKSQREKERFNPYKKGGQGRVRKILT